MRHFRLAILGMILLAAVTSTQTTAASVHPTLSVRPHAIKFGGKFRLMASHLRHNQYYIFLYVPTSHRKAERFLPVQRANKHGVINALVSMPPVPYCGRIMIYMQTTKKRLGKAVLTVTGCKAKRGGSPPPPPSHH